MSLLLCALALGLVLTCRIQIIHATKVFSGGYLDSPKRCGMIGAAMRTKSISRFDAGIIITLRIDQAQRGTVLSLSEYADWLLRENYISKPIRRQTLWRILTKRYYPDLEEIEGEKIDYSKIPENVRGVSKESLVEHSIRDLRGGWHDLRHETHETVSELRERLAQLTARIAALEGRLADLEVAKREVSQ